MEIVEIDSVDIVCLSVDGGKTGIHGGDQGSTEVARGKRRGIWEDE
jgi:hypothetical protein